MRPQPKHSRTFKKSRRLGSSARARTSRVSSLKKPCVAAKQTSSSSPAGAAQLSLLQRLCSHARNSLQPNRLCQGITRLLPFKEILTKRWLLLARSHSQLSSGSGDANNNADRSRDMAAKHGHKPLRRGRNYFDRQHAVESQIDKILTRREYVRQKRRTRAANLFAMKKRAHRSPIPYRNNRNTVMTAPHKHRSRTETPPWRQGRPPGTCKRKCRYRMGPSFNESWVCSPSSSRYKMARTSRNSSPADSRSSCRSVLSRPASYASVRSRDMSYSNSSRCQMANESQQFNPRFAKKSSTLGASRCCHLEDRSPYQSPFQPNHYNAKNSHSNHYNADNRQSNHYNAINRQNNHKKRARSRHSSSSSEDSKSERRNKRAKYRGKQPGVLPRQRALRRLFMCLVM